MSRWALFPSPPYRASTRLGAPTASGWALTITLTGKATSSLAEPAGVASDSHVAKDYRNALLDGPGKRESPSRSPDSFALKDISPGRWTSGPTWPTRRLQGPMGLEARPRRPAYRTLACGPPAPRAQGIQWMFRPVSTARAAIRSPSSSMNVYAEWSSIACTASSRRASTWQSRSHQSAFSIN